MAARVAGSRGTLEIRGDDVVVCDAQGERTLEVPEDLHNPAPRPPDMEVIEDPTGMARGIDGQLEAAIQHLLQRLEEEPVMVPDRPDYEDRTAEGKKKATTKLWMAIRTISGPAAS